MRSFTSSILGHFAVGPSVEIGHRDDKLLRRDWRTAGLKKKEAERRECSLLIF